MRSKRYVRRKLDDRLCTTQLMELARQRFQRRIVEAGADPAHVAQCPPLRRCQQQRAESLARSFWCAVADDHELVRIRALDLDPGRRAALLVMRVGALADDSFQTFPLR